MHIFVHHHHPAFTDSVDQFDQIWRFLHFGHPFKAGGNNYFTQITQLLDNFCKGVKIIHFSS